MSRENFCSKPQNLIIIILLSLNGQFYDLGYCDSVQYIMIKHQSFKFFLFLFLIPIIFILIFLLIFYQILQVYPTLPFSFIHRFFLFLFLLSLLLKKKISNNNIIIEY